MSDRSGAQTKATLCLPHSSRKIKEPQYHHLPGLLTQPQMPSLKPSRKPSNFLLAARASSQHPIFTLFLWQKPWKASYHLPHRHYIGWHSILWLKLSFCVNIPIHPCINQTEISNISQHVPHFLPPRLTVSLYLDCFSLTLVSAHWNSYLSFKVLLKPPPSWNVL